MSFNILIFSVVILAFSLPIFCFLSFRWGVRFGKRPEKAAEQKVLPHRQSKTEREHLKELDDMNKLLRNIDNYKGDAGGQIKI